MKILLGIIWIILFSAWSGYAQHSLDTYLRYDQLETTGKLDNVTGVNWRINHPDSFQLIGVSRKLSNSRFFIAHYDNLGELHQVDMLSDLHSDCFFEQAIDWKNDELFLIGVGDNSQAIQVTFNYRYDSNNQLIWQNDSSGFFKKEVRTDGDSILFGALVRPAGFGVSSKSENHFGLLLGANDSILSVPLFQLAGSDSSNRDLNLLGVEKLDSLYHLFIQDSSLNNQQIYIRCNGDFQNKGQDTIPVYGALHWTQKVGNQILFSEQQEPSNGPEFFLRAFDDQGSKIWELDGSNEYDYHSVRLGLIQNQNDYPIYAYLDIVDTKSTFSAYTQLVRLNKNGTLQEIRSYQNDSSDFDFYPMLLNAHSTLIGSGVMNQVSPWNSLLIATDTTGCFYQTDFSTPLVCNHLTIEQLYLEDKVKIYPNPVSDVLFIDTDAEVSLSLVSITGQVMIQRTIQAASQIDLTPLKTGAYLLYVQSEGELEVHRLLVNR
ncbi:T9SS type A sorting domain-containing protein [bacterium SCSIO 12741]|nr:T9SS type A sorting domain-containing protein [bacterium SCSIO 12741]